MYEYWDTELLHIYKLDGLCVVRILGYHLLTRRKSYGCAVIPCGYLCLSMCTKMNISHMFAQHVGARYFRITWFHGFILSYDLSIMAFFFLALDGA